MQDGQGMRALGRPAGFLDHVYGSPHDTEIGQSRRQDDRLCTSAGMAEQRHKGIVAGGDLDRIDNGAQEPRTFHIQRRGDEGQARLMGSIAQLQEPCLAQLEPLHAFIAGGIGWADEQVCLCRLKFDGVGPRFGGQAN